MPSFKSSIGSRENISLDDVCYLISITTEKDDLGQMIRNEKSFMIFCSKMSIVRSEFNTAGMLGHKPEIMLIVDSDSYDQEKYLEYNDKKYSIYKSFQRVDHFTELYCEVKSGD
jgi:predicted RNA-binding protein associated with RNAse of E/G family